MIILTPKNKPCPDAGAFLVCMKKHWLEILNEHHDEWVAMVRSFGETMYCEDLVQETYIRIFQANAQNRAVIDGKANKSFMYISLRNNFINLSKQRAKVRKQQIEDFNMQSRGHAPDDMFIANDILEKKIEAVMDQWHWYDKGIFLLVINGPHSMRKISRDTTISLSSISNTIKKCKKRLRDELGEDIEDYFNNDFKQIKDE